MLPCQISSTQDDSQQVHVFIRVCVHVFGHSHWRRGQKEDRVYETVLYSKCIDLLEERKGKVLIKTDLLSFK